MNGLKATAIFMAINCLIIVSYLIGYTRKKKKMRNTHAHGHDVHVRKGAKTNENEKQY